MYSTVQFYHLFSCNVDCQVTFPISGNCRTILESYEMYLPTFESRFSPQYIKKSIEISRGETNWGKFIQKGWYVKLQIIMMLDYKSLWYTTCHLLKMTEYPVFGMDPRKTRPHPVFGMDPRKTHPLGPWQHDLKLVLYIENNTVQCIYVWYITI